MVRASQLHCSAGLLIPRRRYRLVLESWMLPQGMSAPSTLTHVRPDGLQNGSTWVGNRAQIARIALQPNSKSNLRYNTTRISRIHSAFAKAYPQTFTNEKFAQHWDTWFTQSHVDQLKDLGINTVRVPVCVHVNVTHYSILMRHINHSDWILDH